MKHGVHIPADRRPAMAIRAFKMREAGASLTDIGADLDISEPTARNLILAGRRIVAPSPAPHLKV